MIIFSDIIGLKLLLLLLLLNICAFSRCYVFSVGLLLRPFSRVRRLRALRLFL
jgi:hypothetical protein